jgi:dihydroxy-acid dehydratase
MQKHPRKPKESLRSHRWYGTAGFRSSAHRARLAQMGYGRDDFLGKPVVAILNPWSDINSAHAHLRERAEDVKRGVWQAGGFPIELPTMSLADSTIKPTTMLYRNYLAIEVEELLRQHPVDGAVLLGGCGKTTTGMLMGGITTNLPMVLLPAGPMFSGHDDGDAIGAATFRRWSDEAAKPASDVATLFFEENLARTPGTAMTMGSASSMALMAEMLGLTLAGASSIPAMAATHRRMATLCGRRIVEMIWNEVKPRDILSRRSFENALIGLCASGGSSNAIINLLALARRAEVSLNLADFDRFARYVPVLLNVQPVGRWMMEDFCKAGGSRAFLQRLGSLLHHGERTIYGGTLGQRNTDAQIFSDDVIRPTENPVADWGGIAILTGNLAPDGCVMRPLSCEPRLLRHTGPALVFDSKEAMLKATSDPGLDVTPDHVLILHYAGPVGGTGMPEFPDFPIPVKLAKAGVKDMLRLSDGRMSGASSGACILHIAPEAYMGGPLAAVQNGDRISVDVAERSISLHVEADEIARRLDAWSPPARRVMRGILRMFASHIRQAPEGCDFDFMEAEEPLAQPEAF